ncbi:DUF2269 family protein [Caballeronia sp. KNU42]|jgi:uncharacterized membrane protein
MNIYLAVKALHVISSVLLVGTGFGSAFYMYFANRTQSIPVISTVTRLVVRADWWFTTPAAVFQPVSGVWLAHMAGWPWRTPWLAGALSLYVLAGACWLPVVWLQLRLAKMAERAFRDGSSSLPQQYWQYAKLWEWLGYPAFIAMVAVYFLMVLKPA